MVVFVFLASIICILGLLFYLLRKHQGAQNDNEPPGFRGAIPVLGHVLFLIGSQSSLWSKFNESDNFSMKKGGVWSFYIFTHVVYFVADPEDALTILNTCLDKSVYYSVTEAWIGDGLLTGNGKISDGSIWKVHRKVMNPAFNQHMLDGYLEVFNYQGRKLVEALKSYDGIPFDPWNIFTYHAFEAICQTLLGLDYSNQPEIISEMAEASRELLNLFTKRLLYLCHNDWIYSFTSLKKRQDFLVKKLTDMTNGIIKERSEQLKNNSQDDDETTGRKFKTLLTLLLEAQVQENKLSHQEIREELDTMITAGFETTATSTLYALIMLGSYPEIQERCYKEVVEVLGDSKDVDKYDIGKLVFLEACIKESLRVMPTVPIIARAITENVKLKNCTLSAGRTCLVSLNSLNRHSAWGPKPSQYNPDRWFDIDNLPTHPMAFSSFSAGKRSCIGKTYAMMAMKTIIAHILRDYEVVADHTKIKFKYGVTLKPTKPLSLVFNKRQTQK